MRPVSVAAAFYAEQALHIANQNGYGAFEWAVVKYFKHDETPSGGLFAIAQLVQKAGVTLPEVKLRAGFDDLNTAGGDTVNIFVDTIYFVGRTQAQPTLPDPNGILAWFKDPSFSGTAVDITLATESSGVGVAEGNASLDDLTSGEPTRPRMVP